MTDLRKSAQQALEALDSGNPYHQQLAAKVLRTALEQQAEPVAKLFGSLPVYDTTPPQQQAEPVAWMSQAGNFLSLLEFTRADAELYGWKPVYTTPPQRPWVGLTDEEIGEMSYHCGDVRGVRIDQFKFARAVEAKIKEGT